jgi:hypothetical protein
MPIKRVLCPKRLRRVPTQFSWIDQRLVRERHIERCDASALALYLLLLTVADAQGLSYYSDGTAGRLLSMTPQRLAQARADLIRTGSSPTKHRSIRCYRSSPARSVRPPLPDPRRGSPDCSRSVMHWCACRGAGEIAHHDPESDEVPVMLDYETYCKIRDHHYRQRLTITRPGSASPDGVQVDPYPTVPSTTIGAAQKPAGSL